MSAVFLTMDSVRLERLSNGTKVYINDDVRFGLDSLLLADFAHVKTGGRLLDVGAGCGIIPLKLRDGGRSFRCVAAELDGEACSLMERSFAENGIDEFTVFRGDARTFRDSEKFDAVASNPPYFKSGKRSESPYRAAARHDGTLTLPELCEIAARNLKERGSLFMCYRPDAMQRLIVSLSDNNLALKRLRFVREAAKDEPWLALAEARFRAGDGVAIMPDLTVRDGNGPSSELQRITRPFKEDKSAR